VKLEVRQVHLINSGDNKHIANETNSRSQRVNDDDDDDDNYLPLSGISGILSLLYFKF